MMKPLRVCLVGGTGFVGRHLVGRLAQEGTAVRVLARHPHRHRDLGVPRGNEVVAIEDFSASALAGAMSGCDVIVNLVGILNQTAGATFRGAHVDLVEAVVEGARQAGVGRYLHMSALNASETNGTSEYLRTKGEGENRAHTLGQPDIGVTSFRPSVIFGPDDSFINRFAQLLRIPGPFPLACATSRFAPVFIGDVTEAFVRALSDPATIGQTYELCGPRVFTLEEVVRYIAWHSGRYPGIIKLSDKMSRLQAKFLGRLPGKPFSLDNYLSLQTDSVCTRNGLADLGIAATDMDAIVPKFLSNR